MNNEPSTPHLSRLLEFGWDCARDAMFVADCRSGLLVDANPAAEKATGFSRQELVGMHQMMLHPEQERGAIQQAFSKASIQGGIFEGFHLLNRNGELLPISISSSEPFETEGRLLIIGIFRDVSDLQEREERLSTKRWALRAYADAALALVRARSSAGLMQEICEAITRAPLFVLAGVGFADDSPDKLVRMAGVAGPAAAYFDGIEISWSEDSPTGQGPTGIAYRTNTVQILEDAETSHPYEPWRERARREGIHSSLSVPFQVEEGLRAVLMVYANKPQAFGPVVVEAFTYLAEEIGIGLNALRRQEQLDEERRQRENAQKEITGALSAVVRAITTAFEMRDPYTAGHQERVATIACAIARELNWDEERIQGLRVASLVHDVGKISIPAEILTKPTRLSAPEWALIKGHPEAGHLILKDVPFNWPIADTVLQHHERLDGSGYPYGLAGDEIMMGARIMAVADVVEAMASSRPYRPSLGIDSALAEIERQAGTKLDSEVVRICLSLFREKGFTIAGWNVH